MTDGEFARAFERGEIPNERFHHRDHVRLAWAFLDEGPTVDAAIARMCDAIRRFATAAGKADKYDEPLTIFWMRAIADAGATMPPRSSFEDLVRAHPGLLDPRRGK